MLCVVALGRSRWSYAGNTAVQGPALPSPLQPASRTRVRSGGGRSLGFREAPAGIEPAPRGQDPFAGNLQRYRTQGFSARLQADHPKTQSTRPGGTRTTAGHRPDRWITFLLGSPNQTSSGEHQPTWGDRGHRGDPTPPTPSAFRRRSFTAFSPCVTCKQPNTNWCIVPPNIRHLPVPCEATPSPRNRNNPSWVVIQFETAPGKS